MNEIYCSEDDNNFLDLSTLKIRSNQIANKYDIEKYNSLKATSLEFMNIVYLLLILILFKYGFFTNHIILASLIVLSIVNAAMIDISERGFFNYKLIKACSFMTIFLARMIFNEMTTDIIQHNVDKNIRIDQNLTLFSFAEVAISVMISIFEEDDYIANLISNSFLTILNTFYFYQIKQTVLINIGHYHDFTFYNHNNYFNSSQYTNNSNIIVKNIFSKDLLTLWHIYIAKFLLYVFVLNIISYYKCYLERTNFCLIFKFHDKGSKFCNLVNTSGISVVSYRDKYMTSVNKFGVERIFYYLNLEPYLFDKYLNGGNYTNNLGEYNLYDLNAKENSVLYLVFKDVNVYNSKLPSELNQLIKILPTQENDRASHLITVHKILEFVQSNREDFKEFICIANKNGKYEGGADINALIFARYNDLCDQVDLAVPNLNMFRKFDIEKGENCLSLAKVTHEFKNPLIAIGELTKTVNERMHTISNIFFNNYAFAHVPNSKPSSKFVKNNGNKSSLNVLPDIKAEVSTVTDSCKIIEDLGNYVMILIKDIDYFSSRNSNIVHENKETVTYSPVNVKEIVQFALSIFETRIKTTGSNAGIETYIDPNVPERIFTDEIRLKQIIINLLSNSLKFTKSGKITLKAENEDETSVKFTVKDTGIGIQAQHLSELTKPYNKIANENNLYGSGLGLTIVKDFVNRLGKDLVIDTQFKVGTSISFLIRKNMELLELGSRDSLNAIRKKDSSVHEELSSKSTNKKEFTLNKLNFHHLLDEVTRTEGGIKPCKENKFGNYKVLESLIQTRAVVKVAYSEPNISKFIQKPYNKSNAYEYSYVNLRLDDNDMIEVYRTRRIVSDFAVNKFNEKNQDVELIIYEPKEEDESEYRRLVSQPNSVQEKRMDYYNLDKTMNTPEQHKIKESKFANNRDAITIIVVEDDTVILNSQIKLFKNVSSKNGFVNIIECRDGVQCLSELYNATRNGVTIHAIVTDQNMHFINGDVLAEVIKRLVEDAKIHPIKMFLLTSMNEQNNVDVDRHLFNEIYEKPLNFVDAKKIVRSVLNDN